MNIKLITKLIKEKRLSENTDIVLKSYEIYQSFQNHLNYSQKKELEVTTFKKLEAAANHNASAIFVASILLFEIVENNKEALKIIKKELGSGIANIVKSYYFTKSVLKAKPALFVHSYNTAVRVSETNIDTNTICAAFLHEIPTHTTISEKTIKNEFNEEIAQLIFNYAKIPEIKNSNNKIFIKNLREMVLAMAADLRVMIIRMCSAIDELKYATQPFSSRDKNIAYEAIEILSPIANLLGIWRFRWRLEDYAFRILNTKEYDNIAQKFNINEKKNRDKYIEKNRIILEKKAEEQNINCQINGRFKHFYSIHKKMLYKNKTFNDITDVFALRVIVETKEDCYRMLGIIHSIWKPKHKKIKDYIGNPKGNNYQSLHTTVFGHKGRLTEFQIRTSQMDEYAKYGIASHWNYKNKAKRNPRWIQEILDNQKHYSDDELFYKNFSIDFLQDRIYTYTPQKDVIALPNGSTAIDFAYNVHSDIGNHCKSVKINGEPKPLNTVLQTNDIVEVVTDISKEPDINWLTFAKSKYAKKSIEEFLNKQKNDTI